MKWPLWSRYSKGHIEGMLDGQIKSIVVISIRLTQQFVENWKLPQIRSKPKVKTNLLESFLKNWKPQIENLSNYGVCHNHLKQPLKKWRNPGVTKGLATCQSLVARFSHVTSTDPICSMYGISTHIYHKFEPNIGKYSTHGASGD